MTSAACTWIATSAAMQNAIRLTGRDACPRRPAMSILTRMDLISRTSRRDVPTSRRSSRTRCGRSRRRGRAEIEIHGWRFFRAWLRGEERARRKSKRPGNHVGWEAANGDVVFLDDGVEFVPLHRNSILGSLKLCLEAPEVFGGGELRVILRDD